MFKLIKRITRLHIFDHSLRKGKSALMETFLTLRKKPLRQELREYEVVSPTTPRSYMKATKNKLYQPLQQRVFKLWKKVFK